VGECKVAGHMPGGLSGVTTIPEAAQDLEQVSLRCTISR
jgi:hypothetical protein